MPVIGVVHHSLNSCGGGELLSLTLAKALKEKGYKVIYYTTQKTDWSYVQATLGVNFEPDHEKYVFKVKIPYFGIYQRLIASLFAKPRKECHLVINTHGDVMPFVDTDITYMHYPTFSLWYENPVNVKYLKSIFWKSYFIPYYNIQKALVKNIAGLILTNSKFSRETIRKYVGRNALVIYPPVYIEKYINISKTTERKNLVLTVGRFTPEKRYEDIIKIASYLPKVKFIIVGSVSNKLNRQYYEKIYRIIIKKKLKNIVLMPNLRFQDKLKLLSRAKVYLHAMVNEHFGISVVEAMASGLIPIVHKSGGPWKDILEEKQGLHGFAFKTLKEAAWYINTILNDDSLRKEILNVNSNYVWKFSKERFRERVLKVVEGTLKQLF